MLLTLAMSDPLVQTAAGVTSTSGLPGVAPRATIVVGEPTRKDRECLESVREDWPILHVTGKVTERLPFVAESDELPMLRQVITPDASTAKLPLGTTFQLTDAVTSTDGLLPSFRLTAIFDVAPRPPSVEFPVIAKAGTVGDGGLLHVSGTLLRTPFLDTEIVVVPVAKQVTNPAFVTETVPAELTCQIAEVVTSTAALVPVVSYACNCTVCPTMVASDIPVIERVVTGVGTALVVDFDEAV